VVAEATAAAEDRVTAAASKQRHKSLKERALRWRIKIVIFDDEA
jgi:hypothetical protein